MNDSPAAEFSGNKLACVRGGRLVFGGLDFQISCGEALVLTGPNGSGKSSLLRMMAGLLKPYAGKILWRGQALAENPEGHAIRTRYVGHLDPIKPVLTVMENLVFWTELQGMNRVGAAKRVSTTLERMRLAHLAGVPGRMLSAGQRRRVNLARLLTAPAPLWLLDEPANSLDSRSVTDLVDMIAEHRTAGGLVVLSTHTTLDLPGANVFDLDGFAPSAELVDTLL